MQIINNREGRDYANEKIDFSEIDTVELQERNLDKLVNGVSVFVFKKKDGTYRTAVGTLNPNTIPMEKSDEAKTYHRPSPLNQTFYDLQKNVFRSYNIESLIAIIEL